MQHVVTLLMDWLVDWMKAHPDNPVSRFMFRQRGPRQDVRNMSRVERLKSALVFLLWGVFFLALWFGAAYLVFGLRLVDPDHPAVLVPFMGLVFFAGIGLVGGLYLLIRVIR